MRHLSPRQHQNASQPPGAPLGPRLKIELERYLQAWQEEHGRPPKPAEVLVPGLGSTTSPMTRQAADKALGVVCSRLGLMGVTPHGFR